MGRKLLSRGIRLGLILASTALPRAASAANGAVAASPQPALLDVTLNGEQMLEPVMLLQDREGGLYASAATFARWRLRTPATQPLIFEGESYYRIDAQSGIRTAYSASDQSLALTADAALFEGQRAELHEADQMSMTTPSNGGFVNYDIFGEYLDSSTSLSGAGELGVFTRHGVGVTSFVGQLSSGGPRLTRLETSWVVDRPAAMTSIRLGDAISVAGPGSQPLRFAGVQYARNFAVQPGFMTMPLPVVSGSAALPSVIDVYVNNVLQGSEEVRSGPFELANLPVPTGGGTIQLVLRDMLGRTVVSEQSYYANAGLLRRGLHDFSYDVGFLRRSFGLRSNDYGELMGSTTHRYGISEAVTIEAHAGASRSSQDAGVGLLATITGLGTVGGSAAISHSSRGTGTHATGSFERRDPAFSIGVRAEYASVEYIAVGMTDREIPPRFDVQAFADAPVGGGAVGMNLVHRDNRGRTDETLAGVFGSFRVGQAAAVQIFARRSVAGIAQTTVGGHVSFSFGGGRSVSAAAEHRRGHNSAFASFQQNAQGPVGNSYRVAVRAGESNGVDAQYIRHSLHASYGADASHVDGRTGLRLSTSGSLALVGGRAFASRTLGSSFATVQVGRYPGVRVYADNQLVGVTDRNGIAVVPTMRAFERNLIRIEEADLPMEVQVAQSEMAVRPFARAGAVLDFGVRGGRGALLQVKLEDGGDLPAGALVRVEGDAAAHVVVTGGELYLPTAQGSLRLAATWSGQSCSFEAAVPDNDDPQPRITGLICRRSVNYAAR